MVYSHFELDKLWIVPAQTQKTRFTFEIISIRHLNVKNCKKVIT